VIPDSYVPHDSTKNLPSIQIETFINGLFEFNNDINRFKINLRDFLISLKEFAGDNAELFQEDRDLVKQAQNAAELERAKKVGGLLKPADLDQDDEL
jgi:exportin-1